MTDPLELRDVMSPLKIKITNRNLCLFTVRDLFKKTDRYEFDFDVYLPSKQMNLQRDLCWTLFQKQELILSILKGVDIPPISVIHRDHSIYYVIDGKQRLHTVLEFIDNEFPIEVKGNLYYFKDLGDSCLYKFLQFTFLGDVAYEYTDHPDPVLFSDDDKIQWFALLNFSGTPQDKEHLKALEGG